MGIRYSNITLYRVNQEELVNYLSSIHLDAYVSPTVNNFTVLYDVASIGYPYKLPKSVQLDSHLKALLHQYCDGHQAAIVCLSSHLSKQFTCSVLAVFAIDGLNLWYHLSQNGQMLDEYVSCGDKHWQPGKALGNLAGGDIKGGDAKKLCSAFRKEDAVVEVETILRKPIGGIYKNIGLRGYEALLKVESYDATMRHEALARALGIRPCWVVGMNYGCCTGEDDFEAHYEGNREEDDPSFEEAVTMVKKTALPYLG